MRRALIRGAAAVILLLALLFVLVWMRTRRTTDIISCGLPGQHYFEIATIPDQIRVTLVSQFPQAVGWHWFKGGEAPRNWPVFGQGILFSHGVRGVVTSAGYRMLSAPTFGSQGPAPVYVTYRIVTIPCPLPVTLLTLLVAIPWLIAHNRQHQIEARAARGLCPDCGYDLRFSADRCPECGRQVARPSPRPA